MLGYPKEISTPVHADHHTVCKFSSTQDKNYTLVVDMIKRLTQHLERQRRKLTICADIYLYLHLHSS